MNFSEKSRSPKQTYVPGGNEDSGSDDDDDVDFSEVGDTSLTPIIGFMNNTYFLPLFSFKTSLPLGQEGEVYLLLDRPCRTSTTK